MQKILRAKKNGHAWRLTILWAYKESIKIRYIHSGLTWVQAPGCFDSFLLVFVDLIFLLAIVEVLGQLTEVIHQAIVIGITFNPALYCWAAEAELPYFLRCCCLLWELRARSACNIQDAPPGSSVPHFPSRVCSCTRPPSFPRDSKDQLWEGPFGHPA